MVKTRHSGDIEEEGSPKLLSLRNEKSRHLNRDVDTSGDVDDSPRMYGDGTGAYNIFEDKVVESRLRPRTGPSHAYNYLDDDSSDEDTIRRQRRHMPMRDFVPERQRSGYSRSHQIKQEMLEERQGRSLRRRVSSLGDDHSMEEEEEEEMCQRGRNTRRRQHLQDEEREDDISPRARNTRRPQHLEDEEDDNNVNRRVRNTGRREHLEDEEEEEDDNGRRRVRNTRRCEQLGEGDEDLNGSRRVRNTRRREQLDDEIDHLSGRSSSRRRQYDDDNGHDEPSGRSRRSLRRKPHEEDEEDEHETPRNPSVGRRGKHSEDEDDDEHGDHIRRSSRRRKQVYDTLNQAYLVSIPGQPKRGLDDDKDQDTDENDKKEFSDMYSRVKRKRIHVKRNMYGVPIGDSDSEQDIRKQNTNNNRNDGDDEEEEEDDEGDDDDEDEDEDNDKDRSNSNNRSTRSRNLRLRKKQPAIVKSYSLREHKPRTDLYKAPVEEPRIRRIDHSVFATTPTKKSTNQTYQSPAQRRKISRKRSALHSSSSSTSSSDSESNDEKSFKRRKAKSMAKARKRMMPMNFSSNAIPPARANVIKDRVKSGASLADVSPMNIDRKVTFGSIGGLGKHIQALKEMVVFPLLYDKVFQRFNVDPPRGVLFYGPPGTGKTLVARALANECSGPDRRVSFFMRKGADCLSKWVGESERQLRLLFDQAYQFRPSIIFFDEIDGLAPVRSSKQDQIHSSIVSTLLALMDGLDGRGEIVVIGATNRIDSIDPALRRPGRFDREFLFPLPSVEARKQILKIHTSSWNPRLNDQFISELADKCVGYCGADLKSLCTEAAMLALRRRYPQIYMTNEALQLDESSINVSAKDFFDAVQNIIPTSQRSVNSPARALPTRVCPLLQRQFDRVMGQLSDIFPPCLAEASSLDAAVTPSQVKELAESGRSLWDDMGSDEDENAPSIFMPSTSSRGSKGFRRSTEDGPTTSDASPTFLNFTSYASSRPATFRPRLMLVGKEGQAQTTYIAPAVIHKMENLPLHVLDLPALYAVTAKAPEDSCANVFHEAKRKCPSIIYMPYINQWWDVMAETLRATLLTLIQDLDPSLPLLLLATSEQPFHTLDPVLQSLFSHCGEVIQMTDPSSSERRAFFSDLLLRQACRPPPQKKRAGDIVKLLQESKVRPWPHSQPSSKKRTGSKRKKVDPTPNFIYPFGSSMDEGEDDSGGGDIDFEVCHEKGTPPKRDQTYNRRKAVKRSKSEGIPLRIQRKIESVKLKRSPHSVFMRPPSINSKHGMVLRSRTTVDKLNSNQSARQSSGADHCAVHKSSKPAPYHSLSHGDDFKKPARLLSPGKQKQKSMKSKPQMKTKLWNSATNSILSDRYDRYVRRLQKLEVKMDMAGSKHTPDCFKPRIRDSHCSLSARHLRYLRRLGKLEEALGQARSSYSLVSHCSYVQSSDTKYPMTPRSSLLSCGSVQMLYKKNDRLWKNGGTRHRGSELALPSNSRDLQEPCCSKSMPYGRSDKFGECSSWHSEVPLVRRRHARYNLRPKRNRNSQRMLEVLPKAVPPKPKELTKEELQKLVEKEELTLMELRIFLREVLNKLGSDKKFSIFAKPVDIDDAPDYYEVIEHPMDLSTMMAKIDLHEYATVQSFMHDIDLVCSNALEYNPNRGPMDRVIRHRACSLKDTAYAIIKTELDKDFERTCVEIEESRKRRGEKSSSVPNFYYTRPKNPAQQPHSRSQQAIIPSYLDNTKPVRSIPKPEGERYSRRVRGINIDPVPPLENVEKVFKSQHSGTSPTRENKNNSNDDSATATARQTSSEHLAERSDDHTYSASPKIKLKSDIRTPASKDVKTSSHSDRKHSDVKKPQPSSTSVSSKKKRNTCVWCKPRRKRPRLMFSKQQQASRGSNDEGVMDDGSQGEEEEEMEPESQGSLGSQEQQLTVDTSQPDDVRSSLRASSKQRSPVSAGTSARVSTRRSSMSPLRVSCDEPQPQEDSSQSQGKLDCTLELGVVTVVEEQSIPLVERQETIIDKSTDKLPDPSQENALLQAPVPSVLSDEVLERSKVVKRLDLDSVTVDSGVGSSVDSNGDSRDSTDHKGESESSYRAVSTSSSTQDINQNCNTELKTKASAILNKPAEKLVVDTNRLTSMLTRLVARTEGCKAERLEKIYSQLSQIIYRHRQHWDRTRMVAELDTKVDELTKTIPTTPSTLRH